MGAVCLDAPLRYLFSRNRNTGARSTASLTNRTTSPYPPWEITRTACSNMLVRRDKVPLPLQRKSSTTPAPRLASRRTNYDAPVPTARTARRSRGSGQTPQCTNACSQVKMPAFSRLRRLDTGSRLTMTDTLRFVRLVLGLVILLYEQRRQQGAGEGEVGRRRSGPVR